MESLNTLGIRQVSPISQFEHLLHRHGVYECGADSSQVIQLKKSLQGDALLNMAIRYLKMAKETGDTLSSICLDQGLVWQRVHVVRGVKLAAPKQCFKNAAEQTRKDSSLTYVEGYAFQSGMPIQHAWTVNQEGKVIDNTWPCGNLYIGLPIKTATLWRCIEETKSWGIFNHKMPKWLMLEHFAGVKRQPDSSHARLKQVTIEATTLLR